MTAEHVESEAIIPLAEETLSVAKRRIERRRLQVQLRTETETQTARADLRREEIVVERVPVNRVVTVAPEVREEDGVTIIPVFEEIIVTTKQLLLREELHIRRVVTVREASEPVEVRRQYATTEFQDHAQSPPDVEIVKDAKNGQ